jgi:hypothetical protein
MEDNQKRTSKIRRHNISQMRIQGKQINSPSEIADVCSKYFITAAGQILTDNLKTNEVVKLLHEIKNDDLLEMK